MKKYRAVIQIELEYTFTAKNKEAAADILENIELPTEYKEDSFEIVKIGELK